MNIPHDGTGFVVGGGEDQVSWAGHCVTLHTGLFVNE